MNTPVYADVTEVLARSASTMQQMSISFGVAIALLATAFFFRDRFHTSASEMIQGIHQAFITLGGLTFLSSLIFHVLNGDAGAGISLHDAAQHAAYRRRSASKSTKRRGIPQNLSP